MGARISQWTGKDIVPADDIKLKHESKHDLSAACIRAINRAVRSERNYAECDMPCNRERIIQLMRSKGYEDVRIVERISRDSYSIYWKLPRP